MCYARYKLEIAGRKSMKRISIALILTALIFSLAQCGLFNKRLEYRVSGGDLLNAVSIRYQNDKRELTYVSAVPGWSTSFNLSSSDRPFLAFIRVTNFTSATVYVDILVDSTFVNTGTIIGAGTVDVDYIVE
jgi:hypothetical protein